MGNECSTPCSTSDLIPKSVMETRFSLQGENGMSSLSSLSTYLLAGDEAEKKHQGKGVFNVHPHHEATAGHASSAMKHRMDGMQKSGSPSYLAFVSSLPDPIFDKNKQQSAGQSTASSLDHYSRISGMSGWGQGRKQQHRLQQQGLSNGALKDAADRYCQRGLESLIYKPTHPEYMSAAHVALPLPSNLETSTPMHAGTPRTVFSCRKNSVRSSSSDDNDGEDNGVDTEDASSPMAEARDFSRVKLAFDAGGAGAGAMSGRSMRMRP